jgi:hypothetical protein
MVKQCSGQRRQGRCEFECNALVYRCEECGAVGCRNNDCSSQNFKPDGRCMKCDAVATWWSRTFVPG